MIGIGFGDSGVLCFTVQEGETRHGGCVVLHGASATVNNG
jgi:hypothetical protein